jgi:hypothetical protein
MSNELESRPAPSQPVIYQIRLKGHLGSQWTDWSEGLAITLAEEGETLLTGPVADQAALHRGGAVHHRDGGRHTEPGSFGACPRCSELAYQRCCQCQPGENRNALRIADGSVARHGPDRTVPIPRRYDEVLALGYVVFRGALETVGCFVTPVIWLLLLALGSSTHKPVTLLRPGFRPKAPSC